MSAGLSALMDKQKLALAGARFRAWWDGVEFDEEAARAAIETVVEPEASAAGEPSPPAPEAAVPEETPRTSTPLPDPAAAEKAIENELFDPAIDPRLQALQVIWGAGRIMPGDEGDEAGVLARLNAPNALALIGPGLIQPVRAFAAEGRSIAAFEWRGETRAALSEEAAALAGVRVDSFDLDVSTFEAEAFDALVSFDDMTYAGFAPHMALQAARALKPGAMAVMDCYVGPAGPDLAHAFASAFAEPQVRQRAEIEHALNEAGFDFDATEDLTDAHMGLVRARFEALPELMSGPSAPKLCPGAARELAWETETWRVRLRMLARRRLERWRFILRRRG
jgi:hypothetical protein